MYYVTLRYVTLCYVTLRYVTLRYVTLRYVTLRYVTLRYITLHYDMLCYGTVFQRFKKTEISVVPKDIQLFVRYKQLRIVCACMRTYQSFLLG